MAPRRTGIIIYDRGFRKQAVAVVSVDASPDSCTSFKPCAPNFVGIRCGGITRLRRTLGSPSMINFLLRPVRKRTNIIIPSRKCLHGYCSLYQRRGILFVTSRVRANVKHANGLLTYSCRGIRPSVLVLNGTLSKNIAPISTIFTSSRVVLAVTPNRRNSACNNGPLTTHMTVTTLRIIHSRRLSRGTFRVNVLFHDRVRGVSGPVVHRIHKGKLLGTIIARPQNKGTT